jgi:hypothetical protein
MSKGNGKDQIQGSLGGPLQGLKEMTSWSSGRAFWMGWMGVTGVVARGVPLDSAASKGSVPGDLAVIWKLSIS